MGLPSLNRYGFDLDSIGAAIAEELEPQLKDQPPEDQEKN